MSFDYSPFQVPANVYVKKTAAGQQDLGNADKTTQRLGKSCGIRIQIVDHREGHKN